MSRFQVGQRVECVEHDGVIQEGEFGVVASKSVHDSDGLRVSFDNGIERYMLNSELRAAPVSNEEKQIAELHKKMDAMATELAEVKALVKQAAPPETPIIRHSIYRCIESTSHKYGKVTAGELIRLDDVATDEVGIFLPSPGVCVETGDWMTQGRYYGFPKSVFKQNFRLERS